MTSRELTKILEDSFQAVGGLDIHNINIPEGYLLYGFPPPYGKRALSKAFKAYRGSSVLVGMKNFEDRHLSAGQELPADGLYEYMQDADEYLELFIASATIEMWGYLEYWEDLAIIITGKDAISEVLLADLRDYNREFMTYAKNRADLDERFREGWVKLADLAQRTVQY